MAHGFGMLCTRSVQQLGRLPGLGRRVHRQETKEKDDMEEIDRMDHRVAR